MQASEPTANTTPATAGAAPAGFDFHAELVAVLPRLRVQALALTRNRATADDLVQDAVVNALAAKAGFCPGTNFAAWMHRILRNRFISTIRRRREETGVDDAVFNVLVSAPAQLDHLEMQALDAALDRLPPDQREALVMLVIEGMSYEEIAAATGAAVGTSKCRVHRARARLQAMLLGETAAARPARAPSARTPSARAASAHTQVATTPGPL